MKSRPNRFVATSLAAATAFSSSAWAVDRFKANNTTNLNLAGSWDTLPTFSDVAVFNNTYATTGILNTGALVTWQGIRVSNPGGNVVINNSTSGQEVALGLSGIDMSAATVNLSVQRLRVDASQTWNVASSRVLTIGSSTAVRTGVLSLGSGGPFTITKSGAGTVQLDTSNIAIGNVNWDIQNGLVRAIWNGSSAWGTGTITLGGGGIATGTNFTGSEGNWTWNNNITLTNSTSSFIDNQNIGGSNRWLKLEGVTSGSGNLEFRDTGTGFNNLDAGFIIAGTNTNTGTVTIASGAEVRVGGANAGTQDDIAGNNGKLAGDSALVTNNGTLTFGRLDAHTVANDISGSGNLRVGMVNALGGSSTSTQVVTLSGTGSYLGTTTVNNGRLNLTGSLTSAVTVASGARISGTGSTTGLLTLSSGGGIALAGGVTTAGLTSNGATFSGSNVLTFLSNPLSNTEYRVVSYGSGALTTPANLTHTGFRGTFSNDTINKHYVFTTGEVAATRTWNTTTGTWAVNSGSNFVEGDQKYFDVDAVVFGNIASDSVITLTGALAPGSVSVTNAANTYTFQTGSIAGATSLAKSGAGTLRLTGANTFTGGTNLTAGSLILSNAGALGSSGTITLNTPSTGASNTSLLVDASAASVTFARPVTVANEGSGITTLGSSAFSATFQAIFSGAVTLNKDVTLTGASGGDRTQFSGGIGGTGNVKVTGPGRTIFITTANTYIGNTEVDGILQLSDGSATGTSLIPDASNVTVNSGGFLRLAKGNNSETIGGLNGAGTVEAVAGANTLIVGSGDAAGSFSGVLKDNGGTLGLTKTGAGTQVLSGPNTYSGPTSITGGTLELSGGSAINDAGAVSLSDTAGVILKLNANETIGSLAGGGSTGGNLNLQANTLTLGNSATTFSGNISGVGGGIVKNGAGNFVLQGSNSFSGTTTVTNGYLVFDSLTAENGGGALVLNGGNLALGSMFVGNSATIGSLSGNSTASTINPNYGNTTGVRTLEVNQTVDGVYQGKIEVGSGGRDMALTKSGNATLTLTGSNTYTGPTSVTGGTLAIGTSGSLGNTTTTIGLNGTLAGGGSISGATTIQGIHSPGFSGGTQTFTNGLSYADTATLDWELTDNTTGSRGTSYDAVNVSGGSFALVTGATIDLSFGGAVDFLNAFWGLDQEWLVVDLSGIATAADSDLFTIGSITGGANWSPSLGNFGIGRKDGSTTADSVYLTWTAVPEPGVALLSGIGLLTLLRRRRVG